MKSPSVAVPTTRPDAQFLSGMRGEGGLQRAFPRTSGRVEAEGRSVVERRGSPASLAKVQPNPTSANSPTITLNALAFPTVLVVSGPPARRESERQEQQSSAQGHSRRMEAVPIRLASGERL